ncbi:cache domain-containing protein [bacterium]|nr:cache domain-containing protein [bacterium]
MQYEQDSMAKIKIILRITLPVFLTVTLFAVALFFIAIPSQRHNLLQSRKNMLCEMTNTSWSLIAHYHQLSLSGSLSLEEAQYRAAERIRSMRYGAEGKDYFWINDTIPCVIMHPYRSDLENTNVSQFVDPHGKRLFVEFVEVTKVYESGFVDYMWQWKDDSTRIVPKISSVRIFRPWGWIVGTGLYIEDVSMQISQIVAKAVRLFAVFLALVVALSMYIIWRSLISEDKRLKFETELRQMKSHLQNVIDSMPIALIAVDENCNVTQWNTKATSLPFFAHARAMGNVIDSVYNIIPDLCAIIKDSIKTKIVYEDNRVLVAFNDMERWINFTIYPLISNGTDGAVILIEDITERIKIEEMMIQSEKMISVGGLAAGMAHEINNPLSGILQNAQVLKKRFDPEFLHNKKIADEYGFSLSAFSHYIEKRGITEMIEWIEKCGRRAAKIVENMLSFSRKSESVFENCEIAELLDNTIELVASDFDMQHEYDFKQINIIRDYQDSLPVAYIEPGLIQQVFLNILLNGAQAMAEAETENPAFKLHLSHSDKFFTIEISDNGPGIDNDKIAYIFEPFYTTKSVGVGTGLGLSVSYFIITEHHHGEMTVVSEQQQGSTFKIKLPCDLRGDL